MIAIILKSIKSFSLLVVIKAFKDTVALDADTTFFKKDRRPFGKVCDQCFLGVYNARISPLVFSGQLDLEQI